MEIRHQRDKPSLNFDSYIPIGDEKECEERSINNKLLISSQIHFIPSLHSKYEHNKN